MSEAFSKCPCRHCGGNIEFPSAGIGRTVVCPHCQQRTLLSVAPPVAFEDRQETPAPVRGRIPPWVYSLLVVALANVGAYWFFVLRPRQQAALPPPVKTTVAIVKSNVPPAPPPDPWHGLMAGPVQIEKAGDGSLIYAVGTLRNDADHERFAIKVQLDIYDEANHKLGTATDYTGSILPGKEWKYKALIVDREAKKAVLVSVKED